MQKGVLPMELIQKPNNQLIKTNTPSPQKAAVHKPAQTEEAISLEKNHVIRGLVTDLRPGEVSIRLANKQAVIAHLEGNNEVSIGDVASFKIVENKDGELTLVKLNSSVSAEELAIYKALEEANLPVNTVNVDIVRELLYHKLPINKESINMILKLSMQFKDAQVSTLVYLTKNGLPLEEGFIETFEQYRSFGNRLYDNIKSAKDSFLAFVSQTATNESDGPLLSFSKQLFDFLGIEKNASNMTNQSFSSIHANADSMVTFTAKEQTQLVQLFSQYDMPEEFIQSIKNNTANLRDIVHHITQALTTAATSHPEQIEAFKTPVIFDIMEQYGNFQQSNNEIASFLPTNERMFLLDVMQDFPLSISDAAAIANGEISNTELLSLISNFVEPEYTKNLRKLLDSKPFSKLISRQMDADFCLTPDKLKEKDGVENYYSSVLDKMKQMKALASSQTIATNANAVLDQAEGVKASFDFMKTFNQLFTYVQLPVKLTNQITHGDLYVYTNKEKLKAGTNQISVLLHLDMDNLGPLDIHLSLTNSTIQGKFYVSDKETKTLLSKHEEDLKTPLSQMGYQLNLEFFQQTKEVDILKDLIEQNTKATPIKRYSFDIRA